MDKQPEKIIWIKRKPARIAIHKSNDGPRRFIMINGRRYIYARWLFEKEVRPLEPGEIVHHIDDDQLNDCIENYDAITPSKHKSIHNIGNNYSLGYRHTEKSLIKMKLAKKGKKLSRQHRINIGIAGKKRVISDASKLNKSKLLSVANEGENNNSAILNKNKVDKIRHRYFWIKDISTYKLADLYNVHQSTINDIIQGRNWNPNNSTKEQLIEQSFIKEKNYE
jgi:hypothetical protein